MRTSLLRNRASRSPRRAQWALFAVLLACAACDDDSVSAPGPACTGTESPGAVSVFAAGVGRSEGIAFLNDSLYVSGGDGIRSIGRDGSAADVASVPDAVGMVAWRGALYVASDTDGTAPGRFCAATNRGVVWKVLPDGTSSVFARGFVSPNFLAVTPWNTLLVSDDCRNNDTIYEVDASGNTTAWNTAVTSANGMAFDATRGTLFVAQTFVRAPALHAIAVNADHSSGAAGIVHTFDTSTTPDGIAVDAAGDVYVALNIVGRIDRVSPDGTAAPFATGLTTPASMAFGDAPGFDPCSMYVTALGGDDVYRVAVGRRGLPLPK